MAGQHWTEQEIRDASTIPDWETFHARNPRRRYGPTWQKMRKMGLPYPQKGVSPQVDPEPVPTVATVPPEPVQEPTPMAPAAPRIVGVVAGERPNVDEIRRRHEAQFASVASTADQRRHQSIRYPHGPVAIVFVGDQHIGNPGTDIKRMYHEQDLINATPGAHVVLTGDIVDNMVIGKLTAQNMRHQMTVPDEWVLAEDYVHRFTSVVAYSGGNHPQWTTRLIGVDLERRIAPAPVLYDPDDIVFDLHVGPALVKIRVRHRWPGNSIYNATTRLAADTDSAIPAAMTRSSNGSERATESC